MFLRRLNLCVLLVAAAGCSYDTASSFADDSGGISDTGLVNDSTPDAPGDDAHWLSLSGTVTISGGAVSSNESSLLFGLYDAKLESLCSDTGQIAGSTDWLPPAEELSLVAGFRFQLEPFSASEPCVPEAPALLELGFGAVDPQLAPAMNSAGLDLQDTSLYGLYVRLAWEEAESETAPIWVYGIAGTAEQYDGTTQAASEPPLPDGTYTLQPLHLLPTR